MRRSIDAILLARAEEQTEAELLRAKAESQERAKGRRLCACGRAIFRRYGASMCGECAADLRNNSRTKADRAERRRIRTPSKAAMLEFIERCGSATAQEVCNETGRSYEAVIQALYRCLRAGEVQRLSPGRYALPPKRPMS